MITAPAVQKEISYSNNFGEYNAKVVKLITKKARMEFVIKKGNHCSVSLCFGTIEGMYELTTLFIEEYKPTTLVNQVHATTELKAMYKAGLCVPLNKSGETVKMPMKYALEFLKKSPSICLALNGETPWEAD